MAKRISARLATLGAAIVMALGCLAITAGAASATEVAYNNLNTVATTVNGLPNEDTYSLDYENFATGGQVELASSGHAAKSLTAQLDVFACERGVYSLENCYTLKPNKKFPMQWTASIYAVGPGNSVGALITSATATFKLHYRPTTNVSCPSTSEGKGFGANCDVGGVLNTVTFKKFSPAAALPAKVIILLSNSCGGCSGVPVNVGLQASYKEFAGGNFIEEPAADGGVPAVGSDPLPDDAYTGGALNEGGWTGFQPVFELTVR
ncbi:MAG: hypothetical protein ACLQBY_15805 [Solirubrobacteraceae bacterium]